MTQVKIDDLPPHMQRRIEKMRQDHGLTPSGQLPAGQKTMQMSPEALEAVAKAYDEYVVVVSGVLNEVNRLGNVNRYSSCIEGLDTYKNIHESLHSDSYGLAKALGNRISSAKKIAAMLRANCQQIRDLDHSGG